MHLLLGVSDARAGLVARIRTRYRRDSPPPGVVQARYPLINDRLWSDIFSPDAQRIVAADVLLMAERLELP